jgi:uncharacterized FlgJ-related protein
MLFKKKELFHYDNEALVYRKTNRLLKYRIIVAVLFLSVSLLSFVAVKKPQKEYITTEMEIDLKTNNTFSEEALIKEIKRLPFKYKDIILAQAMIESGHYKSPLFKEAHNLFGLREARSRATTAKGTILNHAEYDNWKESLLDRLIYEVKYLDKLNREQYLRYLDKSYAQAGGYDKSLEQIIKTNKLKERFDE